MAIGYFYHKVEFEEWTTALKLSQLSNRFPGIQLVRTYHPIDLPEGERANVYHVHLGFLRGSTTLEVCQRITAQTILGDIAYDENFRIVGKRRAIRKTRLKLEKILGIKLEEEEIRERD